MLIQIISDTHFEHHADYGNSFFEALDSSGVDVVILAGDICSHQMIEGIISKFRNRYEHVIYVPGNHDNFGTSISTYNKYLLDLKSKINNFHPLLKSSVTISGQRFVGGTMWYKENPLVANFKSAMPDFHFIRNIEKEVYAENNETLKYFNSIVSKDDVVVTHHLPSRKSIAPMFERSVLNDFFLCDMTELIIEEQPKMWIHGHTHSSFDYNIGDTRIICNPFGDPSSGLNTGYVEKLVIDT